MNRNSSLILFFKEAIVISSFLLLGSCEPGIEDIKRDGADVNLVVEGEVNDFPGPYFLKVSYSSEISNPYPNPKVSNLNISIEDQNENQYNFQETNTKGVYKNSDSTFTGELGNSYHLNINTELGDLYKSYPQKLNPVPLIDTIYFTYAIKYFPESDSIAILEDQFFAAIEFKDNPETEDFYRWRVFLNGEFQKQPESIYLENDLIFNGKVKTIIFSADPLKEDDEILIQQFSLSKSGYEYWNLLKTQATNLGTPFSPAPALIKGNIKNLNKPEEVIIGHFDVSGKTSIQSEVIKP